MNELESLLTTRFDRRILIEANAGTGKTYTIQGLFLRFLVEKNLDISDILVVTFTKLATKELRSRILQRLQDARYIILHGYSGQDEFLQEFSEYVIHYPHALERITRAIRDFDECSIFTIHGFCQRVLTDFSFYTQTSPQFTIQQGYDLHLLITENYWRDFFFRHSETDVGSFYLSLILDECEGPDILFLRIKPFLEKYSFSTVRQDLQTDQSKNTVKRLFELKRDAVDIYTQHSAEIIELFSRHTPPRYLESRLRDLIPLFKHVDEMGRSEVREKLRFFAELKSEHSFFDVVSQLYSELKNLDSIIASFYAEAAKEVRDRYEAVSTETEQVHFQDLLQKTAQAIHSGVHRDQLLQKLRRKWPIAMVDEFQDTDPLQYSIFDSIYNPDVHDGHLCLIGDPKQAIYSFRGADVYTYLHAKSSVPEQSRFSLRRNFRSHSALIDGVNRLIGTDSFSINGLNYYASAPGKVVPELRVSGRRQSPIVLSVANQEKELSKGKADYIVLSEVIRQIQELLERIAERQLFIGDRVVKPSDIVVLLQSNQSIRTLQNRLRRAGIGSVSLTKESIYSTRESQILLALIRHFLDPFSSASGLLKVTGLLQNDESLSIEYEEAPWNRIAPQNDYLNTWNHDGFYPAFYSFMTQNGSWQRIMALPDGERTLSNLNQLATELQNAQIEGKLSPSHMLQWLKRRVIYADSQREDEENDLETDDDRIRLMTLHKSKGLQFPIVFCPDLWKFSASTSDHGGFISYHSDTLENHLDLSPKSSDERKQAFKVYLEEKRLEQIRTAYVGLTRAESQVRLFWIQTKEAKNSGLFGLLPSHVDSSTPKEKVTGKGTENREKSEKKISDLFISLKSDPECFQIHRFGSQRELPTDSTTTVTSAASLMETPADGTPQIKHPLTESVSNSVHVIADDLIFQPKTYTGPLNLQKWNIATESFSSMHGKLTGNRAIFPLGTMAQDLIGFQSENPEMISERMDDEGTLDLWIPSGDSIVSAESDLEQKSTRFRLPKGADFGSFFHGCLEDREFSFSSFNSHDSKHLDWLSTHLKRNGYDNKILQPLAEAIQEICEFHPDDFALRDLNSSEELRELEFYLPFDREEMHKLISLIRDPNQNKEENQNHRHRSFVTQTEGFLTGFIDLIVIRNGKVWIIDYKTNYLGEDPQDYATDKLRGIIRESFYDLQYTLYTLALKRYLEAWLPQYDHSRDFIGVAYLFIRALKRGTNHGIWIDRPEDSVIAEIEKLMLRNGGFSK